MRTQTDRESRRAWLYWGGDNSLNYVCFELGQLLSGNLGFRLGIGSEQVVLGTYLGFFDFYISLTSKSISRWLNAHPNFKFNHGKGIDGKVMKGEYWEERNIGLRLSLREMIISGEWWTNMNGDPRKRAFFIFLADKILGRAAHSTQIIQEGGAEIDMPEGIYQATFKRYYSFLKRPFWPFTKKIERMMIDVPVGIPHEGKGENSWDIGMDATFSSVFPVKKKHQTIYEIFDEFAMECLKDRQKTGKLSSPDYAKWKLESEIRVEQKEKNETPDIVAASDGQALNGAEGKNDS